ncbi:MAG: hypothetical protein U0T82_01630 [Bacteroidales bacterium]
MRNRIEMHNFHIPVMGIGYTIDTPARVAHLGISSVISLVDDILMEKMREFHSMKLNLPFQGITEKIEDFRAKRITLYLDLMDTMVQSRFKELKEKLAEKSDELDAFIQMLPTFSEVRHRFEEFIRNSPMKHEISEWIEKNLHPGSIDVNIMTKLDKDNYKGDEKLPVEYNDAHAALRGFANSRLNSAIVLSAGMNPRLFGYFEKFDDFFPDSDGQLKKTIIVKVSDFRSALIQGKMLAKRGLWVTEFRIESGLNCGGHAFATEGFLLGPVLEEFKTRREELHRELERIYMEALRTSNRMLPQTPYRIKITAQGGVGTSSEHEFLLDYYKLDSVGWGTPFLLVPEVVNIDSETLDEIAKAGEEDLYLSNISPLGVPFNSLRNNSKDAEKQRWIVEGRPGSYCPKQYASLNTEFTDKPICTASRQYQKRKINELAGQDLAPHEYSAAVEQITDKSCICVGLGTSALLVNNLNTKVEGPGVSVCPGPNAAYFNRVSSLKEMIQHIYGRQNLVNEQTRPHMFVKELQLYVDYLRNQVQTSVKPITDKQRKYFDSFRTNLMEGISYYKKLFLDVFETKRWSPQEVIPGLEKQREELEKIKLL